MLNILSWQGVYNMQVLEMAYNVLGVICYFTYEILANI